MLQFVAFFGILGLTFLDLSVTAIDKVQKTTEANIEANKGWSHSGSFFPPTTSEGANLPVSAVEENVPLLVRMNKDSFDFTQTRANGENVRLAFSISPVATDAVSDAVVELLSSEA
jgi:hypothetical protein